MILFSSKSFSEALVSDYEFSVVDGESFSFRLGAAERHFHSGLIHELREKFEENLKVNRKSNETQLSFKQ